MDDDWTFITPTQMTRLASIVRQLTPLLGTTGIELPESHEAAERLGSTNVLLLGISMDRRKGQVSIQLTAADAVAGDDHDILYSTTLDKLLVQG